MLRKLLLWLANYLKTVEHKPMVLWKEDETEPVYLSEGDVFDIPYNIGSKKLGIRRIGIYGLYDATFFYTEGKKIKGGDFEYWIQAGYVYIWDASTIKSLGFYMNVVEPSPGAGFFVTRFTVQRCRKWNFTVSPPTYKTDKKVRITEVVGYTD